jgi:uncharacterized membrane protein YeaQ/YmgE (transglycosylase-associated protein family)
MKMNLWTNRNRISIVSGLATLAVLACGPAQAEAWGGDSMIPLADQLTDWVGLREMTGDKRDMLVVSVYLFGAVFGILTRMSLRDLAFGMFLNGVVGAVGVCLALYAFGPHYHLFPQLTEGARFNVTLIGCGFSASILLVIVAGAKNLLGRTVGNSLDGLNRPDKPKPVQVEEALPPRVASALRKN